MRSAGIVYSLTVGYLGAWSWNSDEPCPMFVAITAGSVVILLDNTDPSVPDVLPLDLSQRNMDAVRKQFGRDLTFCYQIAFAEEPGWSYFLRPKFEVVRLSKTDPLHPPEEVPVELVPWEAGL